MFTLLCFLSKITFLNCQKLLGAGRHFGVGAGGRLPPVHAILTLLPPPPPSAAVVAFSAAETAADPSVVRLDFLSPSTRMPKA